MTKLYSTMNHYEWDGSKVQREYCWCERIKKWMLTKIVDWKGNIAHVWVGGCSKQDSWKGKQYSMLID